MFDLEAAVAATMEEERRDREVREHAMLVRRQKKEAEDRAQLLSRLHAALPCDIEVELGIQIVWDERLGARATFELDGQSWKLAPWGHGWAISPPTTTTIYLEAGGLLTPLLRAIGKERESMKEQADLRRVFEEEQAKREQERVARQAEHDRCRAKADAAMAEALESAWKWPEDARHLVLYRWQWCIAAGAEGSSEFEYGWSDYDRLNAAGYVPLKFDDQIGDPRLVRLDMVAHKPVVTRYVFKAIAELPHLLTEPWHVEVEGIGWYDDQYLREEPNTRHRQAAPQRRPLKWVCDLIDR